MRILVLHFLLVLLASLAGNFAEASVLSVDEYLRQVVVADPGYQSQLKASDSAEATSKAANLFFHPQFFTKLQYVDDTRDTSAPLIQGTSNIQRNVSVGFREQTPYGLGLQLSLDVNQTDLFNTDPALVTRPQLTNTYVVPVFNFSLWQNFLGHADQANQKVTRAEALATSYAEAYRARATLVEAEVAYWKLATAQEVARVEEESASRARAILEHDSGKAKKHLGDSTDLLLAQAAVKGKELELRGLLNDEHSLARAFNTERGIDADDVPEELQLPDSKTLEKLEPLKRAQVRGDVQAAEQVALAQSEGSRLARERLLPDLNLYGSIFAWGINLTVPMDVWTTSAVRDGYAEKEVSADLEFQKKSMQDQSEWKDLVRKFSDAKERLSIALELEQVQQMKFQNVRKRQSLGLTIEDQVFQYELDYLNSSLARVQIEGMILALHAQMKLYGELGEGTR